jgi:hypothetical protein
MRYPGNKTESVWRWSGERHESILTIGSAAGRMLCGPMPANSPARAS